LTKGKVYAHILFLDVVGYSRRPTEEQEKIIGILNGFVEGLRKKHRPKASEDVLRLLPTGDGMVVVFFDHPKYQNQALQPLLWAAQINGKLKEHNASPHDDHTFALRIGLHSEYVKGISDANNRQNVIGPGINLAQRIMDAATPGAILASSNYSDILRDAGDKFAGLLGNDVQIHVKHLKKATVCNVHGVLDGNEIGLDVRPEDKPRIEMIPEDLRHCVLDAFLALTDRNDASRAFALAMLNAHKRRFAHLKKAGVTDGGSQKWRYVDEKLQSFQKERGSHTYLELSSLIQPDLWKSSEWKKYHEHILNIARNTECLARRLHILSEDDLLAHKDELIPLMIAELSCSIRGRVWLTRPDDVQPSTEDMMFQKSNSSDHSEAAVGYRDGEFCLLDCGTFYRSGGYYDVILSDIKPYFKVGSKEAGREAKEFAVVQFHQGEDVQSAYEELRANFLLGWHDRNSRVQTFGDVLIAVEATSRDFGKWVAAAKKYLPIGAELSDASKTRSTLVEFLKKIRKGVPCHEAEDWLLDSLKRHHRHGYAVVQRRMKNHVH